MFQTVYAVFKQDLHIGVPHTPPCPQKFTKNKLQYFGHISSREGDNLEKMVVQGYVLKVVVHVAVKNFVGQTESKNSMAYQ